MSWVKKTEGIKRQSGRIYNLYLMNPKSGSAACEIAEKLMKISAVEEVLVTEGDYGFMVKAKATPDGRRVYNAIQGQARGETRTLTTSYYRYRK
jgi:DNA-binding Lrp family transcriptional regulator